MPNFIDIPMNAARICDGLSKIGYTPPSAITDIIDNSVQAGANKIYINIIPEREDISTRRRNNVKEYLIVDNGKGMNEREMLNALALGSSADDYDSHSLSKFGLGLKSASFSQGESLTIVSSDGSGDFQRYNVSLIQIREQGKYVAEKQELDDRDHNIITQYLTSGRGTIVRISEVRKTNHPSIRSTIEELRTRIGVIYFYMMSEDELEIYIEGKKCESFDPLFTNEANIHGNLDENSWDGKTTQWIQKPMKVTLDTKNNVFATVEVTQLPHPPTFALDAREKQKETRDKYMIAAGNYGFYVYRNRRLLSWAESFNIIPQDQDYYAFRGRLIVDETADETLNIDVKKAHVQLSEEAYLALDQLSDEYKRKSRKAWGYAKSEIKRISGENSLEQANVLIQQTDIAEDDFFEETVDRYEEAQKREEEILTEQKEKINSLIDGDVADEETIEEVVRGKHGTRDDRVFLVESTEDFALWEPYYDADKGTCVRINRLHRFARVIYEDNSNNLALIFYFGAILLQLSKVEVTLQKYLDFPRQDIRFIMSNFRIRASHFLNELCRQLDDELPRDS